MQKFYHLIYHLSSFFQTFHILIMVQKKTTLEEDQDIIKNYLNGTTPKILQNKYNISSSTFGKILKDNNIQPIQAKRYSAEEKLSIANAYKDGKSALMVAKEFNIAESNVLKICRALNIEVRKHTNRVTPQIKKYVSIKKQAKIKNNINIELKENIIKNNKIIVFNNIELLKENILSMTTDEKEKTSEFLFDYFRNNGFPYPNYKKTALQKDWKKLKDLDPTFMLNSNIINNSNTIKIGNKLWKQFSEHYFDASDGKKPSLFEAFNDDIILKKAINNRLGITYKETFSITANSIIQSLKVAHLGSVISIFNTAVAKLIYEKYTKPNDIVYDFSMGFGQRLLGAMSSNNSLTYIGTDPWSCAVPALTELSNFIEKSDKCQLNNLPAEDFCPEELQEKINFAFSSPPYFNIEIYEKHESQANFNKTYDQFINEWWLKVAKNIHKLLAINGKLALNMKQNILNDMNIVLLNNGFKYVETLYIRSSRAHLNQMFVDEPIAIYEKI